VTLWGGAHCAPANTDGFLDGFTLDRGGVHVALFHGSERSWLTEQGTGKVAHAPFDAEQIERVGLDHVFLGHYHRPRDAARHTYPGNPEPLTFGEDGDRGVVIASISPDGGVSRDRRAVSTNDVYDGEIDVTPCRSQQDIRERVAATLTGRRGVARLTFTGDLHPDVNFDTDGLHDSAGWMDAVVVRIGGLRPGYDLGAIANEPTVRGQFVQDVMAANLTDDLRRRVLITGLRALDGRDDLEVP
jgi:DNA repair protein SbcD/Mre11